MSVVISQTVRTKVLAKMGPSADVPTNRAELIRKKCVFEPFKKNV